MYFESMKYQYNELIMILPSNTETEFVGKLSTIESRAGITVLSERRDYVIKSLLSRRWPTQGDILLLPYNHPLSLYFLILC